MATREEVLAELKRRRATAAPKGVTREDVLAELQRRTQAPVIDPNIMVQRDPELQDIGVLEGLGTGFRLGVSDIFTGAAQRASELVSEPPAPAGGIALDRPVADLSVQQEPVALAPEVQEFANNLLERHESVEAGAAKAQQAQPAATFIGRIGGQMAALPLPGASQGHLAMRVGANAATGALAGFLQPTDDDDDPRTNALVGALAGGGLTALAAPMQRLVRKLANRQSGTFTKPEIKELLDEADRLGIPVFADDALDSPFASFVGRAAEEVPVVGTGPGRVAQAQAQKAAVQNVLTGIKAGMQGGVDDVDLTSVVQKSLVKKFESRRQFKNTLWQRLAAKSGDDVVNLDNTRAAAMNELIEHVQGVTQANRETVESALGPILSGRASPDSLKQILGNTQGGDPGLFDELLKLVRAPEGNMNHTLNNLRRSLSSTINAGSRGQNTVIQDFSVVPLNRVKEALQGDLEAFIATRPDLGHAFQRANKFTERFNIEGKKTVLKQLLSEGGLETPEKIMRTLQNGPKSTNRLIFRNLDNEGRQAVKAAIIQDAVEKSVDESGSFLADKFVKAVNRNQNTVDVFFRGQDAELVEGVRRVIHLTRASQRQFADGAGINVLGRRLITPGGVGQGANVGVAASGIAGGVTGGVAGAIGGLAQAAAAVGGTGLVIRQMLQSPSTSRLLMALGKQTPGTAAYDRTIQRMVDVLQRGLVIKAAEE